MDLDSLGEKISLLNLVPSTCAARVVSILGIISLFLFLSLRVTALVVAVVFRWPANPVMFGLGDLRGSETVKQLHEEGVEARTEGTLWASNVVPFDTVSLANGVPTLSGLQRPGPDMEMWERIDPGKKFEEAWNRGGGYVPFGSAAPGEETEISTNGFDLTFVTIDPCVLAEAMPELGLIASSTELTGECLQADSTMEWAGNPVYVYEVVTD